MESLGVPVHAEEGFEIARLVGDGDAHLEFEFGRLCRRSRDRLLRHFGVNAVLDNRHVFASLEPHVVGNLRRCASRRKQNGRLPACRQIGR